ncbi:hypothetical protein Glove_117g488 [Diversispora epigaea]|uniref:DUF4203 domain-containing protein n=1 Tax=Diversispora epigaea TaxID=1348612 RepID=A0A397J050_9GLOM|nr:hypothetical protein Glove_117g488 [Diversispora epigaea]
MSETTSKFLFLLTCLFPIVSASLPLADMFNFETKEYIPYTIVSAIFLIAFIPISQLKKVRKTISLTLNIFVALIFPSLFFYMTRGFTKLTIISIAFSGSIIASILIVRLILLDESRKGIATITFFALIILILIIFPPLFLYATESFNLVTIIFLILFVILILTFTFSVLTGFLLPEHVIIFLSCITVCILVGFHIVIHGAITVAHFSVIVLVINLVARCCLVYLKGTIATIIVSDILGGINYYIIFYALQSQVNPISLLLFWADLWTVLFSIYTVIENFKEFEGTEAEAERLIVPQHL